MPHTATTRTIEQLNANTQVLTIPSKGSTIQVFGSIYDNETRCTHWHTDKDIIALKFACCGKYWPCYQCHNSCMEGPLRKYAVVESAVKVVLCGSCAEEMTFQEYIDCDYACKKCHGEFNPGCKLHYGIYFDLRAMEPKIQSDHSANG